MPEPGILILDDDEMWLAWHERRLKEAGFKCRSTRWAEEAIDIARKDASISFALIDEILFVPPVPVEEQKGELQRWQGSGVVREVRKDRQDIEFIMVTSAPQFWSRGNIQILTRETAKLRRLEGVVEIVHKQDIKEDPDREYGWLVEFLRRPRSSAREQTAMPRILIGLGFHEETYKAMAEQAKEKEAKRLSLSPFLAMGERILDEFAKRANDKRIFIEMPGSKKLVSCPGLKPDSSAFRILMFLAERYEKGEDPVIREEDYRYSPRQPHARADTGSNVEPASIMDFAFGYDEDDRRRLRNGIQIEGSAKRRSTLKVAVHRLSQQLAKLNVGPARHLFQSLEPGAYRPNFKTGIFLYSTDIVRGHRP